MTPFALTRTNFGGFGPLFRLPMRRKEPVMVARAEPTGAVVVTDENFGGVLI